MSDVHLIVDELVRITFNGIPQACSDCAYRRRCRTDAFDMCMVVKETKHRLEEWQKFKEAEDDGK